MPELILTAILAAGVVYGGIKLGNLLGSTISNTRKPCWVPTIAKRRTSPENQWIYQTTAMNQEFKAITGDDPKDGDVLKLITSTSYNTSYSKVYIKTRDGWAKV